MATSFSFKKNLINNVVILQSIMFRVREVQATHVFQLSTVQEIQHRYFIEQLILLRKLNTKTQFSFNLL